MFHRGEKRIPRGGVIFYVILLRTTYIVVSNAIYFETTKKHEKRNFESKRDFTTCILYEWKTLCTLLRYIVTSEKSKKRKAFIRKSILNLQDNFTRMATKNNDSI